MLQTIISLLIIAINALILKFTLENENEKCECALKWHHEAVKYLAPVVIVVMFVKILFGPNPFNNFRLNVIYGVLLGLLGVTYLIILTSQFIDLKIHNCECSEDWKRVLLLYPLVPVAFGILSLLHVLVFKPNLLKAVVKKK